MQQHTGTEGPPPGCPAHDLVKLYGPAFGSDPEAHYAYLRSLGPTAPVEVAEGVEVSLVTSYQAALAILKDPNTSSATRATGGRSRRGGSRPTAPRCR
jgi:cytochrome P450